MGKFFFNLDFCAIFPSFLPSATYDAPYFGILKFKTKSHFARLSQRLPPLDHRTYFVGPFEGFPPKSMGKPHRFSPQIYGKTHRFLMGFYHLDYAKVS